MTKVRITRSVEDIDNMITSIIKNATTLNIVLDTSIMKIDNMLERLEVLDTVMAVPVLKDAVE
jgi:hypothetical protein